VKYTRAGINTMKQKNIQPVETSAMTDRACWCQRLPCYLFI